MKFIKQINKEDQRTLHEFTGTVEIPASIQIRNILYSEEIVLAKEQQIRNKKKPKKPLWLFYFKSILAVQCCTSRNVTSGNSFFCSVRGREFPRQSHRRSFKRPGRFLKVKINSAQRQSVGGLKGSGCPELYVKLPFISSGLEKRSFSSSPASFLLPLGSCWAAPASLLLFHCPGCALPHLPDGPRLGPWRRHGPWLLLGTSSVTAAPSPFLPLPTSRWTPQGDRKVGSFGRMTWVTFWMTVKLWFFFLFIRLNQISGSIPLLKSNFLLEQEGPCKNSPLPNR